MKNVLFIRRNLDPRSAFALVEVVMAMGVVGLCLMAIVGVLSTGLAGMMNADEQSGGATIVEEIASSIRGASTNSQGAYVGLGMCTNLTWQLGGGPISCSYTNLSLRGTPSQSDARLVAYVQLSPPATLSMTGTAIVSVAWPAQAKWNESGHTWTNAQGSLSTYLVFLPRP